ncbi:outer membrane protein assembly factor BamB family protein [Paenibacillus sp. JCM 10914]
MRKVGISAIMFGVMLAGISGSHSLGSEHITYAEAASGLKNGQRVTLQQRTALFPDRLTSSSNLQALKVSYYGGKGETYRISSVNGEMTQLESDSQGTIWVPSWYASQAARQVKEILPVSLKMNNRTSVHLSPGSGLKWPVSIAGTSLTVVAQWKDWYGVLVSPAEWKEDYYIYRPALMWVQGKDITGKKTVPNGLLDGNSEVSIDVVRNITEFLFKKGTHASYVKKLLGEPQVKEASTNQEQNSNLPMVIGETWRYEARDVHFTVTFSSSGKLTASEWIIPTTGAYERRYSPGDDYEFTYSFAVIPPKKTIEASPAWRNQGNLNFTFLLEANEGVLLVKGDDGGFSGMHNHSSLYAIDRSTGKKLWQEDAGFGWYTAVADQERKHVTMFSAYNPAIKDYEARVRHIRLSDGKVLWEVKPKNAFGLTMTAAADVVILNEWLDMNGTKSVLSVLDQDTGKQLWKKTLSKGHRLHNQSSNDSYVLIEQNGVLEAYNPKTGKAVWNYKVGRKEMNDPISDPYYTGGYRYDPVAPADISTRWMLLGSQWVLLNTRTGEREGTYPAQEMERFEVLNERYLLVQRALDGEYFTGATAYESILYDSVEDKEVWTLKGRATHGVFDGERMYLTLNGIPAAVDQENGSLIWKMKTTLKANDDLSHLVGSSLGVLDRYILLSLENDLMVLDKEDGKSLGRLHSVVTGNADLREQYARNGALSVTDQEVLVGTVNGAFIRYDAAELVEMLDGL